MFVFLLIYYLKNSFNLFMQKLLLFFVAMGFCTLLLADDVPENTWSESGSLDTVNIAAGKTITLLTTDQITYSTKWAFGDDRQITLSATRENASPYDFMTSAREAEGTYCWDYTEEDPSIVPLDETYTLSYTIHNGDTVYDTQRAVVSVALMPEPGVALGLLTLALLFVRKK